MPLQATSGAASYDAFGGGVAAVPQYIEDVFSTYLYTGNGSSQTITNGIDLAGEGGLVWLKGRSVGYSHGLFDTVRGADYWLNSASTDASTSVSGIPANAWITGFNSNGFGVGSNGSANNNGTTYASWTFRKQPKFFDVVTYTGNATNGRTVAHSLGSVPGCMIVKRTDAANGWAVYHRSMNASPQDYMMRLNATTEAFTTSPSRWNNTLPTSTEFTLSGNDEVNGSGATYVAYIFAHNAGGFGLTGTDNVISCGSYTGNALSDGPTITLGYEPQWILVKDASFAANWQIVDTMRGLTVESDNVLRPNTTAAEYAQNLFSPTATGFKVTTTSSDVNREFSTFIYIAIRRGPMKVPTSGTSVFSPIARSGTGATSTVSNSITTDLIISMTRNTGQSSGVWDRLRGVTKYLETTGTASESTSSDSVTALNNNAYVLGADSATDRINRSGYTYANWTFSRAPSFFDEVCYTGNGTSTPFNHNLGVTPELIITKIRDSGTPNWGVWHKDFSPFAGMLFLNSTSGTVSDGYINSVSSTQFSFATANGVVNSDTRPYVAYLFATCAGVSKVGSYTGNGSSQTINCGFAGGARFVLIKRIGSTGDWYVWDSARGIVAGNDPHLSLNSTSAEVTTDDTIDADSSGFIVNQVGATNANINGTTYIYLAIA